VTPSRIEENFQIVELSQEDFDKVNGITFRQRTGLGQMFGKNLFPDLGD